MTKTLATVGISGSQSNNDVLRHWLKGNGYDWEYDHFGRLTAILADGERYQFEFKCLDCDTMRIFAVRTA